MSEIHEKEKKRVVDKANADCAAACDAYYKAVHDPNATAHERTEAKRRMSQSVDGIFSAVHYCNTLPTVIPAKVRMNDFEFEIRSKEELNFTKVTDTNGDIIEVPDSK